MKLRRIEIQGFKSFRFKTGVEIADGVTAIVGPNGCGKSNVVDALRWALGSQSPKDLRGRSMEDVIFAGSQDYKPHGFAEVTLAFENDRGQVPAEWRAESIIRVTRRLFRTGESEYLVNDVRVRLQDVHSIFLGTGVGSREAYSIIEQGRIGFVVASRPRERRSIIEEAAGITRYKHQRKTAGRRLEQTQENLRRVGDVIDEVKRQLASLTRQAKRAAKWRELSTRKRHLEIAVALERIREARKALQSVEGLHGQAERTLSEATRSLAAVDTRMQSAKVEAAITERHDAEATEEAFRARARTDLLKNNVHHQERELGALRDRVAGIAGEQRGIDARVRSEEHELTEAREALKATQRRRSQADDDLELLEADVLEARERLIETQTALSQLDAELAKLQGERARASAELNAAEAEAIRLEQRHGTLDERAQRAKTRLDELASKAEGASARLAESQRALERAEEDRAAAWDEAASAREAHGDATDRHREAREALRRASAKVDTLESLLRDGRGYADGVRRALRRADEGALEGIGRPVAERLRATPEAAQALALVWGGWMEAVVAQDLASAHRAVAWARAEGVALRVVVAEPPFVGDVPGWCEVVDPLPTAFVDRVEAIGWVADVTDDSAEAPAMDLHRTIVGARGFFDVRANEATASEAVVALVGELDEARAHLGLTERELVAARRTLAEATEAHEDAEVALSEVSDRLELLRQQAQAARRDQLDHHAGLARERQALEEAEHDRDALSARLAQRRRDAAAAGEVLAQVEGLIATRDHERQALSARTQLYQVDAQSRSDELAELRAQLAAADERARGLRAVVERAERGLAQAAERRGTLTREVEALRRREADLVGALAKDKTALDEAVAAAQSVEVRYQEAQAAHQAASARVRTLEDEHLAARRTVDRAHDVVQRHALDRERSRGVLTHALEQLTDDLQLTIPDARAELVEVDVGAQPAAELGRVRARIDALGPVNPAAEEEYAEAQQRFTFLETQRDDLVSAIRDLETAIRKMDRTSRERFAATFEAVNERFQVLFTRLFEGGKGRLELTDPEDLLQTGVEIVAQPPGKRLQSMQLMSGGEKAMTAVALVFAIFQLKPTPFCLLDEVDAPLDDANVGRFTEMVREMSDESQFIIITHNRATMESAHTLYGVTMEEPGVSKVVGVRLQSASQSA